MISYILEYIDMELEAIRDPLDLVEMHFNNLYSIKHIACESH